MKKTLHMRSHAIGQLTQKVIVILLFVILTANFVFFEVPETRASGAVTNLYILDIEVTQAIQCLDKNNGYTSCADNSLELESARMTTVRVYIGHDGACSGADPLSPILKGVKVELRWIATHQPDLPNIPDLETKYFDLPCSTNLNKLRDNTKGSVNFIIPPAKLGKPNWKNWFYVRADVFAPQGLTESNTNDNFKEIELYLYPHAPLKVTWIPVKYKPANPWPTPLPNNILVDTLVAANSAWLMQATYPMTVTYSQGGFYLDYSGKDVRDPYGADELLNALAFAPGRVGLPGPLLGWLPKGANTAMQIYGDGESSGVAWVIEDADPETNNVEVAHEIQHTKSIDHTVWSNIPDKILEAGFWGAHQFALPGYTGDYMRESAFDGWISPYSWNKLLGQTIQAPQRTSITSLATTPSIWVSGHASKDGTSGELDPLYRVSSEGPFPVSNPAGEYSLDFETLTGTILSSHRFDVSFTSCAYPTKNTAGFFFELPFPSNTERLVLRHGTTVLAERSASGHAPDLVVTAPQGGEVVSGTTTVSWIGNDQDGDTLHYIMMYSPDGGNSLYPIAIGVESTSIEMLSTLVTGGDNAMIRVMATDGWNTVVADSALFKVTRKPPIVFINTPSDNAQYHHTDDVILTGGGQDVEDGELDGNHLSWASDRDGFLGTGSLCFLYDGTLSLGWHVITLTATDSDGQTDTTSVKIFVGLPVADAGGPYFTYQGIPVTLDASGSSDPMGKTLTYEWDFDNDGKFDDAFGVAPTFIRMGQNGVFPIKLRAVASDGASDIDETNVVVYAPVMAKVDIDPDTLNLRSKGKWITAYIQLPEGYNAADINASTILLNGTISPVLDPKYGFVRDSSGYLVDHNNDGILERMVKFEREAVESFIYNQGIRYGNVALTITGRLLDETPFEGTDVISVNYGGDVNGDRTIDVFDILKLKYDRSGPPSGPGGYDPNVDINKDGYIDVFDVLVAKVNLGQTVP